jgi:hypothetical protein
MRTAFFGKPLFFYVGVRGTPGYYVTSFVLYAGKCQMSEHVPKHTSIPLRCYRSHTSIFLECYWPQTLPSPLWCCRPHASVPTVVLLTTHFHPQRGTSDHTFQFPLGCCWPHIPSPQRCCWSHTSIHTVVLLIAHFHPHCGSNNPTISSELRHCWPHTSIPPCGAADRTLPSPLWCNWPHTSLPTVALLTAHFNLCCGAADHTLQSPLWFY